ncbi:MAG: ABC transporter ATP-binding protein [Candidatus Binatia bacterium]
MTPQAKLRCEALEVHYGEVAALKGVDVEVPAGQLVCVIGPNGAGKTTLLRTVCGLEHPSAGRLVLDGTEVGRTSPERMLERGVALVPEGRHVFPHLTVHDNLVLGAFRFRRERVMVEAAMRDVFGWFGVLEEYRERPAATLSGGEQQMLAIGRALMARPSLLCLDEPSLGLAPLVVRSVLDLLRRLCEDGVTVLLVEQFAYLALRAADVGYLLENGSIARSGPASDLLADELVRTSYLGIKSRAG